MSSSNDYASLAEENELLLEQLKIMHIMHDKYLEKIKSVEKINQDALTRYDIQYIRELLFDKMALEHRVQVYSGIIGELLARKLKRTAYPVTILNKCLYINVGEKKLTDIYKNKGIAALESVFDKKATSLHDRAEIYTRIAKNLRKTSPGSARELAKMAWMHDPKPYRFKWLLFRTADAGDFMTADAMLDYIDGQELTDKEQQKAAKIREKARIERSSRIDAGLKEYASERTSLQDVVSENMSLKKENEELVNINRDLRENSEKYERIARIVNI